jgi:hypothetical protein
MMAGSISPFCPVRKFRQSASIATQRNGRPFSNEPCRCCSKKSTRRRVFGPRRIRAPDIRNVTKCQGGRNVHDSKAHAASSCTTALYTAANLIGWKMIGANGTISRASPISIVLLLHSLSRLFSNRQRSLVQRIGVCTTPLRLVQRP